MHTLSDVIVYRMDFAYFLHSEICCDSHGTMNLKNEFGNRALNCSFLLLNTFLCTCCVCVYVCEYIDMHETYIYVFHRKEKNF